MRHTLWMPSASNYKYEEGLLASSLWDTMCRCHDMREMKSNKSHQILTDLQSRLPGSEC